jgi:hypothetical protein
MAVVISFYEDLHIIIADSKPLNLWKMGEFDKNIQFILAVQGILSKFTFSIE